MAVRLALPVHAQQGKVNYSTLLCESVEADQFDAPGAKKEWWQFGILTPCQEGGLREGGLPVRVYPPPLPQRLGFT